MRLIDADELTKNILSETIMNKKDAKIMDRYLYVIQNEPTAYDIDKVVEELEKSQDEVHKAMSIYPNISDAEVYGAYENAIEIVKDGGKSES